MVGLRSLANTVHTNTVEQLAADVSPAAASAIELGRWNTCFQEGVIPWLGGVEGRHCIQDCTLQ
jgi:hypothetical protein